jgi:integrase/recombinase XerD
MAYQYKREPLYADEADRMMNACDSYEERLVVWLLLETGLRVSELSSLTRENVQWQEGRLTIYGKGGPYGKKSKRRIVPLSERARRLIDYHFTDYETLGLETWTIQRLVKKVANRAKISKKITPHVLRHTFAVNCIKRGINIRALMTLLGHDNLNTTMRYLNLSPEDAIAEFRNKW